MEKQTMGAFISALRKSKGITQKELAEMLSVSDKAVSRWECDQTTPDIYLLPMIADIFGVSVDELIRGEKIKNEQPTEAQEKSIQKRLESIFVTKFNSYKTKSIIPLVVTIVGFILACVLREIAYYEIGIGVSIILFICSIACQIFFLLNFKNSTNTSDINSDIIAQYKRKTFDFSFLLFTILLSIEALIISVDPNFFIWCGPVCAIAVLLISRIVKSLIVKKLNLPLLENEKQNYKLFIKVFISFVCIIGVLAASMITINVNCDKWIEKPEVFYVTDSTKVIENYIENQLLNGYGQCDYPVDDEEIDNEIKVTITDNDILFSDVIEYSCFIKGYNINDIEKDGKPCKEVKLWTASTRIRSRSTLDNINIIYIILYCVCAISAIGIYIIKSKKK